MSPRRRSTHPSNTAARLFVAVVAALLLPGCLVFGPDLNRKEFDKHCAFDVVDAWRCLDYKSNFRIKGVCSAPIVGIYRVEGELSWNAEKSKISERYDIEPLDFVPHTLSAGEFLSTATCDSEPYVAGTAATCTDTKINTTVTGIETSLLASLQGGTPLSFGVFKASDLAEFPIQTDCKPTDPVPVRKPMRKPQKPGCEPERVPALIVTSPTPNASYDIIDVDSFTLDFQPLRQPPEQVEIEWQKLDGRFQNLAGLPTLVTWRTIPLVIALTDDPSGAGEGTYRVRARPHDEECPRVWSFWQEFGTKGGGPALSSANRRGGGDRRQGSRGDG